MGHPICVRLIARILSFLGYFGIHQASSREGVIAPRRPSPSKGIYRGMEKILYSMLIPTYALWAIGVCITRKNYNIYTKNKTK